MMSYSDSVVNLVNTGLKMSLFLVCGSYWRNFTPPLIGRHKGTSFQIDNREHIWMQDIHTQLEAEMAMHIMAATITQSLVALARSIMHKLGWHWKLLPCAWMTNVYRRVQCWGWHALEFFFMTRRICLYDKDHSYSQLLRHTDESMSSTYIEYASCSGLMEVSDSDPEEMPNKCSVVLQDMDLLEMEDDFMDRMATRESLRTSCTNPLILSMICVPSEDEDGSSMSECDAFSESEIEEEDTPMNECEVFSESEMEDEATSRKNEESSYAEDISADSGMQELWSPGFQDEMDSDQEGSWSEDSWDTDCNTDWATEGYELWSSFCKNDDPYNPLSFSMPLKSAAPSVAKVSIESVSEDQESYWKGKNEDQSILGGGLHGSPETSTDKIKRVRFSPVVSVRPMITWSYAHRAARKGPWEEYARDRCRFQKRIAEAQDAIGFCLEPQHREKVWARLHEPVPAVYAEESTS